MIRIENTTRYMIVLTILVTLGVVPVVAQESFDGRLLLAPTVPTVDEPLEGVVLREVPIGDRSGISARFVRLGESGSLRRPGALELPVEGGRGIQPYRFDWIKPVERTMEVREEGTFHLLARIETEAQIIFVAGDRIELLDGALTVTRDEPDATPLSVSAGTIEVFGRGFASIERDGMETRVLVRTGQFDVYESGSLVSVLGAGNERLFRATTDPFTENLAVLRRELSDIIVTLRSAPSVDGATMASLWSVARTVAAQYARGERTLDATIRYPDIVLMDIAEAMRILGGYRFAPSRAIGM